MYTITGNKTFWADNPDWATTMFLTYTHQNYWDRSGQDRYGSRLGVLSDWLVSMASRRTYLLGVQTIRADAMTALPSRSPSRSAIAAGWAMTCKTAQAARLS